MRAAVTGRQLFLKTAVGGPLGNKEPIKRRGIAFTNTGCPNCGTSLYISEK